MKKEKGNHRNEMNGVRYVYDMKWMKEKKGENIK